MSTTGGKAYLMVLNDILELSQTPDYASHPRQQPNELLGFQVPDFMVKKMKSFVVHIRTDPSTPDSNLLKQGEEQVAKWEITRKALMGGGGSPAVKTILPTAISSNSGPTLMPSNPDDPDLEFKVEEEDVIKSETDEHTAAEVEKVEALINQMKREDASATNHHHGGGGGGGDVTVHVDDDLGFLHGMKLADLVREFELEAANGPGSQHLGILSLADGEEAFPELPDPEEDPEQLEPEELQTQQPDQDQSVITEESSSSADHQVINTGGEQEKEQQQLKESSRDGQDETSISTTSCSESAKETTTNSEPAEVPETTTEKAQDNSNMNEIEFS